ncbi:MAG TPA: LamG-like jellyroll fold domain-containing protein [Chthoniobacteraceae bacterium]|nr:LamG-like jellyroll fold domain-containing protein [Chthoniobacteraceae bacterium]
MADGSAIVSKYTAVFTQSPTHVPTRALPDGPLLGNGDLGVVAGGSAADQTFYIGKNDFWASTPKPSKIIAVGRVELSIPALAGASYREEQDMAHAEVRGIFAKDGLTVRTASRVDANENLLVTELESEGAQPVAVSVRALSGPAPLVPAAVLDDGQPANIGREAYGGGRWYFNGQIAGVVITAAVLDGKPPAQPRNPETFDGKTTWHEMTVPRMDKSVSVAAWIKINAGQAGVNYIVSKGEWNHAYSLGVTKGHLRWSINGTNVETQQSLETGKWIYVAGTFDGSQICLYVDGVLQGNHGIVSDPAGFVRNADQPPVHGRRVAVQTRVVGADGLNFTLKPGVPVTITTAILSDLDAADCQAAAGGMVAQLTPSKLDALKTAHRAWWSNFWNRSFIEIPDKEIERHWYAALYIMGSCSRPGKVAPGLWGNWITTDSPLWSGDFHLNYNFQAPFFIVYSSNHADLSLPMYEAMNEWMPEAEATAKRHGWKGVHYPVGIGPWGLQTAGPDKDWGQRSDAAYAAINYIWYWQYTRDDAWLRQTGYPYLREVAAFWENYLKDENGRYVIYNDSIHEGSGPDFNSILSLGLVRTLFKNMLAMSEALGVDADKRAKWQDILARISAFPLQQMGGKTVFRYSEKGTPWNGGNTLGIQHIFPAGAIGLDSDPKLLEISRNMIDAMKRWDDNNGFSTWYSACARVGYDPEKILAGLHTECERHSMPNLAMSYGGGGIENGSGFLAINEMLLQSNEGVLRLFPDWPRNLDARFGDLRADGAFLVSAQMESGAVNGVVIRSEKGCPCTIQNPWPGRRVSITGRGELAGDRFTFKMAPGETVTLTPAL